MSITPAVLHRYDYADDLIQSEIPLPGLRATDAPTGSAGSRRLTVLWDLGAQPELPPCVHRRSGRFSLGLHPHDDGYAWSTAEDGCATWSRSTGTLRCYPASESAVSALASAVVRRILPQIAAASGCLVLHASAVARDGEAVLLTGASGAGKSTLAAAFAERGAAVLADDLALVALQGGVAVSLQSASSTCLWPDSLTSIGRVPAHELAMPRYEDKRCRIWPNGAVLRAPIAAVWCVDAKRDGPVSLAPLVLAEVAATLWPRVLRLNPDDPAERERAWRLLVAVIARVPTFELTYPRGLDRLASSAGELAALRSRM